MPYKDENLNLRSRSWFCVFNNPSEHGWNGSPDEILQKMHDVWLEKYPQGRCALRYCVSADGLQHVHAVLESDSPVRFGSLQKLFYGMHITPTKGNKSEALAYINKQGKWAEKGEKILASLDEGELKGYQGKRTDIDLCVDLINQGKSPREVLREFPNLVQKEPYIKRLYYNKRDDETPMHYEVTVYWHIGVTGSGKSYSTMSGLSDSKGRDNVYCVSDYDAPFDGYNGEPVLILDEYRGSFRYQTLLEITDCLKRQIHARYCNVLKLWNEVHITSIMTPEQCYAKMVSESDRGIDTLDQLKRRISYYVYHAKVNDCYLFITIPSDFWRGVDFAVDCLRAYNGLLPVRYKLSELLPVLDYNAEIGTAKAPLEVVEEMKNNNSYAFLADDNKLAKIRKNTLKELSDNEDLPF